jgi:hypothetical protein
LNLLPDEAAARLHAGQRFIEHGRRVEVEAKLAKSLTFWRNVGATAFIRETTALLRREATA